MNIDLTKVSNNLSVIEHYRVSNNVNYYQSDFQGWETILNQNQRSGLIA